MEYERGDRLVTLPCAHQYHEDCIKKWMEDNKVSTYLFLLGNIDYCLAATKCNLLIVICCAFVREGIPDPPLLLSLAELLYLQRGCGC